MARYLRVPKGTAKGAIVGYNGMYHMVCEGDLDGCIENQPRHAGRNYYDEDGNTITTGCYHSVDLPICSCVNGCTTTQLCVPADVAAAEPNTPVFTEEYANDGTPIPLLALAGAIPVGCVVEAPENCGGSRWDQLCPTCDEGEALATIELFDTAALKAITATA